MKYLPTATPNPFGAPVYHVAETGSTMNDARTLARQGEPDGTAIYADYQSAGRGRVEGRRWDSVRGQNLLCTVLLRRPPVSGFTLRVGLAIAQTFDHFLPAGISAGIKWPNDIVLEGKKLAGVLCENDADVLYIGAGLNIAQREFPAELVAKATSLALVSGSTDRLPQLAEVLELYLENLGTALEDTCWQKHVTERLYRLGERIDFLPGDPEKNALIEGYVEGIGTAGELLFRPVSQGEIKSLFSGEIPYTPDLS